MNIFARFFAWLRRLLFGGGSNQPPPLPQPAPSGWSFLYSANVPAQLNANPDGSYWFDFPQQDGVHYVLGPLRKLTLGQTITMKFAVIGDGKLIAVDKDPIARVRLIVQKRNDDGATPGARWWSAPIELTAPGEYTLTATLAFGQWSGISGESNGENTAFAACITDCAPGFTFGGWSAGHGVYAQGPVRFVLRSFEIR